MAAAKSFRVGYLARIAPEKGLRLLAEAYVRLRTRMNGARARLEVAGYLAPEHRPYLDGARAVLANAGLQDEMTYHGEIDRAGKRAFLRGLDVLSVPATYDEPKGMSLLEAMASGVPVVQPRRGAFIEVVNKTGGGLLVEQDDPDALASGLHSLWADPALRERLGAAALRRRARALHDCALGGSPDQGVRIGRCWRVGSNLEGCGLMLTVSDVGKAYPTPRGPLAVLSDVTFSLSPGEAAAITGPSGSGKSSLLYMLGALEPPSTGEITLGGQNPFLLPAHGLADFRNAQIGFVFQDHCLLPQCTVLENVLVPTLVAARNGHDEGQYARTLLEQVGLSPRLDHRPAELSGGEKQRVAIARALVRKPRLILCDEPTGNLDQTSASGVASLLLDLHKTQQNILIVVTHSERLAAQFPIRFDLAGGKVQRVS